MAAPRLHNSAWNRRLEALAPHLEEYQQRLDLVSNDIRGLEKFLTETGFRIQVRYKAGEVAIDWREYGKTWRLCYVRLGDFEVEESIKPLIETPAAQRMDASDMMAGFFTELETQATKGPALARRGQPPPPVDAALAHAEAPSDDDIPF